MADVMPRGHGGDGADEPPPGGFGRRGHHEEDRKCYCNLFIHYIYSFLIKNVL
ncbi:hypothetical protein Hanom_Chr05g00427161 [Helianthus anomalus]